MGIDDCDCDAQREPCLLLATLGLLRRARSCELQARFEPFCVHCDRSAGWPPAGRPTARTDASSSVGRGSGRVRSSRRVRGVGDRTRGLCRGCTNAPADPERDADDKQDDRRRRESLAVGPRERSQRLRRIDLDAIHAIHQLEKSQDGCAGHSPSDVMPK